MSIKEYFVEIKPVFKNVMDVLKTSDIWYIGLMIAINFALKE